MGTIQGQMQAADEERKELVDARREGARTFDKTLLTVASGTAVLTVAVLKDLGPFDRQILWLLGWAWVLLATSIFVSLFSFLASQKAGDFEIERHDERLLVDVANRWNQVTHICNWASLLSLLVGVVFWLCFVYASLDS